MELFKIREMATLPVSSDFLPGSPAKLAISHARTVGKCCLLMRVERTASCKDADQHNPADNGSNVTDVNDTCASYSISTPESV